MNMCISINWGGNPHCLRQRPAPTGGPTCFRNRFFGRPLGRGEERSSVFCISRSSSLDFVV